MSPQVRERVPVVIAEYDEISRRIARRIADVIADKRKAGSHAVLGLATGSTPIGIYRELSRLHREEGLDFSDIVTFNLDEYYPMRPDSIHSYNRYMWENLFDEINVKPENVHVPRGDVSREQIAAETESYERAIREAGGLATTAHHLDLRVLNGHRARAGRRLALVAPTATATARDDQRR